MATVTGDLRQTVPGGILASEMQGALPLLGARTRPLLAAIPYWDDQRRILWCCGGIVKEFRQPAKNQEDILNTFQEEDWPPHADSPLSPKPGQDERQKLHDTLTRLNRQKNRLIRFRRDRTGDGIIWEPIPIARRTRRSRDT